MFARVAQWWSIALPRRGSRVRIPSRAFNDTKKEVSAGYLLFCMFKPCRARTVRMSTLRCGRRSRTSPGRSATSRALNDRWEAFSYKGLPIFLPFLKQKPKITVKISKAAAPKPIRPFMINGAAKHLIKPYPSPTAANESIISRLENTAFSDQ